MQDRSCHVGLMASSAGSGVRLADLTDVAFESGADGVVFFQYRGDVVRRFIPALLEGPLFYAVATPWAGGR